MASFEPFLVGNRVVSCKGKVTGTVKFIGKTEFADDEWVGIELDKPEGKNDGSVKGVKYFCCEALHGLFMRPSVLDPCVIDNRISVRTSKKTINGHMRFLGSTKFADGDWLGVELEQPEGKNNGSVNGITYFTCAPSHGIFVRPSAVRKRGEKRNSKTGRASTAQGPRKDGGAKVGIKQQSEADVQADVKRKLGIAMEEHDLDELRWLVPRATKIGIDPKELEHARDMLSFLESKAQEQPSIKDIRRALSEAVKSEDLDALRDLVPLALKHDVPEASVNRAIQRLEFLEFGATIDDKDVEEERQFIEDLLVTPSDAPIEVAEACEPELLAELRKMCPECPESLLLRAAQEAESIDEALDIIMDEAF